MRDCPYCSETHGTMLLCDPARRMLDALVARGQQFNMPTIEFDDPVPAAAGMFGGSTVACTQLVVKAGLVPAFGATFPALMLTGRDVALATLPEWVWAATPEDLRAFSKLVGDMTEMAIRRAKAA